MVSIARTPRSCPKVLRHRTQSTDIVASIECRGIFFELCVTTLKRLARLIGIVSCAGAGLRFNVANLAAKGTFMFTFLRSCVVLVLGHCPCLALAAEPIFNSANGHYYTWVDTQNTSERERTWQNALNDAESMSFRRRAGHLATITSQTEQDFLAESFGNLGGLWIGASDRAVEGEWRWMAGPETGELFWLGNSSGQAVTYAAWSGSEPNNLGHEVQGEDFAQFNWGSNGAWNDLPTDQQNYLVRGHIVEFSVPEPSGLLLSFICLLSVTPYIRRIAKHNSVPRSLIVTCLMSVCLVTRAQASSPGPHRWDGASANRHVYEHVLVRMTWENANAFAQSRSLDGVQGHLATITSEAEWSFIRGNFDLLQSPGATWIGAYQDESSPDFSEPGGSWSWVTREPWEFAAWGSGEPNDFGGASRGHEQYAEAFPGHWNDERGLDDRTFLIEYPVPEPSSTVLLMVSLIGVIVSRRQR